MVISLGRITFPCSVHACWETERDRTANDPPGKPILSVRYENSVQ